jgi:hypothetical protein
LDDELGAADLDFERLRRVRVDQLFPVRAAFDGYEVPVRVELQF